MTQVLSLTFTQKLMWLARKIEQVRAVMVKDGEVCKVDKDEREAIAKCVERLQNYFLELKLNSVYNPCFLLTIDLRNFRKECYYRDVEKSLRAIHWAIHQEVMSLQLVFIPPNMDKFLERDELFGKRVNKAFPSAKAEIKDAGNSLAVGLNDAAVFYLMRVVESGLRTLARHLKVKKVKTRVPLEFGTWEEIIVELEYKIKSLGSTSRGQKRQQMLDFYNDLLKEFRAIKDLWRNKVMHARVTYDSRQAQDAFNHVRAFMQQLATRISE